MLILQYKKTIIHKLMNKVTLRDIKVLSHQFYQSNYARYLQFQPTVEIAHTQNQPIEFKRVHPLKYIQPTAQRQMEHMHTNEVGYNHVSSLAYNQPTALRQMEQTMNKPIEFNQAAPLAHKHLNTHQLTIQNILNSNQVAAVVNKPRSYNRPI